MYINVIAAFSLPKWIQQQNKWFRVDWLTGIDSTTNFGGGLCKPFAELIGWRLRRVYSVKSRWWRQSHRVTGSSQLFSLDTQSYNTDEIHSSIGVVQWNRHSGKLLGLLQPQLWILKFCVSHLDGWWRFFQGPVSIENLHRKMLNKPTDEVAWVIYHYNDIWPLVPPDSSLSRWWHAEIR